MSEKAKQSKIVVAIPRPGGEPEEIAKAHDAVGDIGHAAETYKDWGKDKLVGEYKRLNTDFNIAMKSQNQLLAILGVLVEKYNITDKEIGELRKIS